MQDLTLIGVHEDGLHLLLADAEGNRYTVPLDDSLRAAARRDRPRLGQLQIELAGGLRPAAVQSMIRAGLTAEEVADRAGWTVEKVHKYEGPILAEREHVAGLARQVRLRSRGGSHGASTTLEARVSERLRSREIDPAAVSWDSRRADKGEWIVSLAFAAGGREREALWRFDPLARIVAALDDESRWLSEDDDTPAPGPLPAPHLATPSRPATVYDVEAEGGVGAPSGRGRSSRPTASARRSTRPTAEAAAPEHTAPAGSPGGASAATPGDGADDGQPLDLVAAMRQRNAQRGRRRRPRGADVPGLDEAPEEALPLEELALDPRDHVPPPAQHPHPDDEAEPATDQAADEPAVESAQPEILDATDEAPADDADDAADDDDVSDVSAAVATDDRAASEVDGRDREDEPEADPEPVPEPEQQQPPAPRARRVDRTQPLRQTAPAGRGSSKADGSSEGDDDGHELIEEQVASPAATTDRPSPSRPAARKGGRPSVPSWDDIMFGRKGD
jgi:hypothetical protein